MDIERYSRQTLIDGFGESGQRKLFSSRVLVVGLGGLGAPVASYLVASGVGCIGLCDPDTVSLTNLQRQILYSEKEIGERKTDCALRRLGAMSPETEFRIIGEGLTEENAERFIADYDVVMDCTDNFSTRRLIGRVCRSVGIPWVHGSIEGTYGSVTVFNHDGKRQLEELYEDIDDLHDDRNRIIGTFGPVPGVVGSLQAMEAIKVLTGFGEVLDGRLLTMNMADMTFTTIEF